MRKFLSQFVIYGCASMLSKIAAIFLMPLYTSILTTGEYGAMAMLASCSGVLGIVANFNIHTGIARDYYEEGVDRKKLISTGFFSIVLCSLMMFLVMFMTRRTWTGMLGLQSFERAFVIMLANIPAFSLQSYFSILTRFKNKPILFVIGTVTALILQISLSIYLVLVRDAGIEGILFAECLANIYSAVFFFIVNREFIGFTFDNVLIKRALAFAIPTLPATLAWWIDASLGQMLVGKYVSYDVLGVYSISLSITSVFSLITIAFNNVWGPYLYENYKKDGFAAEVKMLYGLFFAFLMVVSINLSLLSHEIVLILAQPTYLDAVKYITLLCLPLSLYMLLPFVTSGIQISRKTKYLSYANCAGSLVNLIILVTLLPRFGVIVAPLSLTVSRLVNYFISKYYSDKVMKLRFNDSWILLFVVIIAVCYLINITDVSRYIVWAALFVIDATIAVYFIKQIKSKNLVKLLRKE